MADPIYLAGPTASGKSAVALLLAERLDGEIISVDSMQVYRGMNIGTAKPSSEERARTPHHLIDVAAVDEGFHVARFLTLAHAAEEQIAALGRRAIFCGGTGLYFNALAGGVGSSPPSDPELRQKLEATPLDELLPELEQSDLETFQAIDHSNPRRIVRALEVIRLTGQKFSALRATWKIERPTGIWIGFDRNRADLRTRIDERVDHMFARGLVKETEALLAMGLRRNRTALQALGYRQVVDYLDGRIALGTAIELVKTKTRQYAKRQMTWFKHQLPLTWLPISSTDTPEQIADRICLQPPATT